MTLLRVLSADFDYSFIDEWVARQEKNTNRSPSALHICIWSVLNKH